MATIDSRTIVDQIIAGNGRYFDDPRVVKIVEYVNKWGGISYGVIYQGEDLFRYKESPWVLNPQVIFQYQGGK